MASLIRPEDIVLAVVGNTGSGKSSFIAKCTGQSLEIEHGLSPYAELLEDIAVCLNHAYISGVQISGIIYLHPINNTRVQGSAMKSIRIIKEVCGPEALSLILLGSSLWDKEDFEVAKRREDELTHTSHFWGSMIENGSRTFRFYNDQASALIACDHFIEQRRNANFRKVTLALQHQMINEGKTLNETDAGMEVEKDILQLKQICKSKIEEARLEAQRAVLMNDEAARSLTATQIQLQNQLTASERALESMCGDMIILQAQSERQLRDQLRQLQLEEQRDRQLLAERENELERLDRRLTELNNELESSHLGMDRLDGKLREHTKGIESYIAWSITERTTHPQGYFPRMSDNITQPTIQPPQYFPGASTNTLQVMKQSLPIRAEAETVSEESARCKKVIAMCQERQIFRRHKIDTCVNRLGAAAGVVGTVFQ